MLSAIQLPQPEILEIHVTYLAAKIAHEFVLWFVEDDSRHTNNVVAEWQASELKKNRRIINGVWSSKLRAADLKGDLGHSS